MSVYRAGYKNRGPVTVGVRTCISFSNRTGTPTPSRRLGVWRLPRLLAATNFDISGWMLAIYRSATGCCGPKEDSNLKNELELC